MTNSKIPSSKYRARKRSSVMRNAEKSCPSMDIFLGTILLIGPGTSHSPGWVWWICPERVMFSSSREIEHKGNPAVANASCVEDRKKQRSMTKSIRLRHNTTLIPTILTRARSIIVGDLIQNREVGSCVLKDIDSVGDMLWAIIPIQEAITTRQSVSFDLAGRALNTEDTELIAMRNSNDADERNIAGKEAIAIYLLLRMESCFHNTRHSNNHKKEETIGH